MCGPTRELIEFMFDIRPVGVGVLIYVQSRCADLAADDLRLVGKCPALDIRNLRVKRPPIFCRPIGMASTVRSVSIHVDSVQFGVTYSSGSPFAVSGTPQAIQLKSHVGPSHPCLPTVGAATFSSRPKSGF